LQIRKSIIALIITSSLVSPSTVIAGENQGPIQDSEQLRLQDMLVQFLIPSIREVVINYYNPNILNVNPDIEPWRIELINTKRINGFRGFILQITIDVQPSVGHHVPVGKDRITYQISYGPSVSLINYAHLETYKLPSDLEQEFIN
jgi:hypothetical protein